jgi:hypothetical protein
MACGRGGGSRQGLTPIDNPSSSLPLGSGHARGMLMPMVNLRLDLLKTAVACASRQNDPSNGLFPAGMLVPKEDGTLRIRWGTAELIEWDRQGTNALESWRTRS